VKTLTKESIVKNVRLSAEVVDNCKVREIFAYQKPRKHSFRHSCKSHLVREPLSKIAVLRRQLPTTKYIAGSVSPSVLKFAPAKQVDVSNLNTLPFFNDSV